MVSRLFSDSGSSCSSDGRGSDSGVVMVVAVVLIIVAAVFLMWCHSCSTEVD